MMTVMMAKEIIARVPELQTNKVYCWICGKKEKVNMESCLRYGWPKCCNHTLSIDDPERAS